MTLIVSLETSDSADGDEETRETDPLLALAGTLDLDVTEIKKRLKNAVRLNNTFANYPGFSFCCV